MQILNSCQKLLSQVSDLVAADKKEQEETGSGYNVFTVSGMNTDEVRICSIIADLLNPNGKHMQGTFFLRSFAGQVLHKFPEYRELNYIKTRVYKEFQTDKIRRIDIALWDDKLFIPIEVKIHAGDQKEQITHYAKFTSEEYNGNKNVPVLYLTLNGHKPTTYSTDNEQNYHCISFVSDIIPWLENCVGVTPIDGVLHQFIDALKQTCGIGVNVMDQEILKKIVETAENYGSAKLMRELNIAACLKNVIATDVIDRLGTKCINDKNAGEIDILFKECDEEFPESLHISMGKNLIALKYTHNDFSIYKATAGEDITNKLIDMLGFKPEKDLNWKSNKDCIWYSKYFLLNFLNDKIAIEDQWCMKDGKVDITNEFVLYKLYTTPIYRDAIIDKLNDIINVVMG